MNEPINELTGHVVWVHSPNIKRLPFMAYIASIDVSTIECYLVHDDEYLATADDLIYWPEDHDHNTPLVIQPRLVAEFPVVYVGQMVTKLSPKSIKEISQIASGIRRATDRTGVLVRSTNEFRWDHIVSQKEELDGFLSEVELWEQDGVPNPLLLRVARQLDNSSTSKDHLAHLLRDADFSVLGVTEGALKELGVPGLAAEYIAAACRVAANQLLLSTAQEPVAPSNASDTFSWMQRHLHVHNQENEMSNV
jgi:hypothetical protein